MMARTPSDPILDVQSEAAPASSDSDGRRGRFAGRWVLAAITASGIGVILVVWRDVALARQIGALITVLILPGLALVVALFPRASLSAPERVAYVLGLSLSASTLVALVLTLLGTGLRPASWGMALGVVVVLATAAGVAVRRRAIRDRTTSSAVEDQAKAHGRRSLGLPESAVLVAAALIAAAALKIAHVGAVEDERRTTFTQLWIYPDGSHAGRSLLGVRNFESGPQVYSLELVGRSGRLRSWSAIDLARGQTLQIPVTLPSNSGPVQARLYRGSEPARVYRWVSYSPPLDPRSLQPGGAR